MIVQLSSQWVSATATRNWCIQDPILDWLDLYGRSNGFVRDDERRGYDAETDMGRFLLEKGRAFEVGVMRCLEDTFEVVRIGQHSRDAHDADLYERTLKAMADGVEIIYQPVVQDLDRQTFGVPDLLVRSDVLNRLANQRVISDQEAASASILNNRSFPRHYRVVDIKFTSLDLNAQGFVGNDSADRRKKAQLLAYNRALGIMQGYEPPVAYLIGRGWKQTVKSVTTRSDSCLDRLAPADMREPALGQLVDDAIAWIRRLRAEGGSWQVAPKPSVCELHPNMSNTQDSPWHTAKKEIAERTGELTLLWRITPKTRPSAHQAGIVTFNDARCDSTIFGLAESYAAKLQKIIEINREGCPDKVRPAKVSTAEVEWREPGPLEFYVDFETVSDLNDDLASLPQKGGQALIYMIGCGHIEDGKWTFRAFTCDRLTEDCERAIINAWHEHMAEVRQRLWPTGKPLVFHWSHAEQSFLNTAYNSARKRHAADWPDLDWFDFLVKVMREEPITVKGALSFGLKSVAKAMHRNGLIETEWTNGPGDGLAAMVGAWRCDDKVALHGGKMIDLPLMQRIEAYNEVDCKVMWEIVSYLRTHH